ncbi:MAG: hypothetical protein ACXVBW_14715, partial [Bdellovibrionota bacterium]
EEYDKIVISNQGLSDQVASFKLDPEPTQLYPDGHPALAKTEDPKKSARQPAAKSKSAAPTEDVADSDAEESDSGTIKPFFSK